MVTEKSPPYAEELGLLNHVPAGWLTSTVTFAPLKVTPELPLNWKLSAESERVVEYPVTTIVNDVAELDDTWAVSKAGAWLGTVTVSVCGLAGVTSMPAAVRKSGVSVIVPAIVPVCNCTCVRPLLKKACV
jgi:hypothetical protein